MASEFNLVETILDEPGFSIFARALVMTGLADKLKTKGPFTVMVPSNAAFTNLPESKLIELLKPANKENIAEIIKYHVVEGRMMAADFVKLTTVATLQGQTLRIDALDFCFKVNGASLKSRNIEVSNGVIHTINAVLFPAFATSAV